MMRALLPALLVSVLECLCAVQAAAAPIVPLRDDEVIETLPAAAGRSREREWRRRLWREPGDAGTAVALARRQLDRARAEGDPRFAGQALAVLSFWRDDGTAPAEVLLLRATLQQFLHDFDAAAQTLEVLLRREPRHAQAWLTLATLHRVQGRYDASDAACARVRDAGAGLHGAACRAENDGLRGRTAMARASLERLRATPGLDAATRSWLLTTLGELEVRAGEAGKAERAYAAALAAAPDDYTRLSHADFLIGRGRDAEALAALGKLPRTDAVVLRLAIAGRRAGAPAGDADAREMRERIAAANQRPQARTAHAREQAMFALAVEQSPGRAVELARANVQAQREPLDLLLFVQAAGVAGDDAARREAGELVARIGLRDARIDALH